MSLKTTGINRPFPQTFPIKNYNPPRPPGCSVPPQMCTGIPAAAHFAGVPPRHRGLVEAPKRAPAPSPRIPVAPHQCTIFTAGSEKCLGPDLILLSTLPGLSGLPEKWQCLDTDMDRRDDVSGACPEYGNTTTKKLCIRIRIYTRNMSQSVSFQRLDLSSVSTSRHTQNVLGDAGTWHSRTCPGPDIFRFPQ
jgi:hypothetical protein